MIRSIVYDAEQSGPELLVLGAVHGNEVCGPAAIERVCAELDTGRLTLTRGRARFVPVCNPRAYAAGARFIERNLNRYLVPMETPDSYEARLGNILCPLLERCDALLDLHSSPRGNVPYAFVGPANAAEYAFAASLGASWLMTGWEETYAAADDGGGVVDPNEGIGTEQAVRRHGGLAALVECGDHSDTVAAADVAYRAIHGALRHLGMIEAAEISVPTARLARMSKVFYRTDAGRCAKDWQDFDAVKANELIATRANGEQIRAPADGLVILPHPDAPIGGEWFYFGQEEAMPLAHTPRPSPTQPLRSGCCR